MRNDKNELRIKSASLEIHEIFVKNNWTWGGIGNDPAFVPSTIQIENHIRDLIGLVIARGTAHSSGRIFVDTNDEFIDIAIHFNIERLEKEKEQNTMDNKLIEFEKDGSVLPERISKTGSPDEPLTEIIICTAISGGADYVNEMPRRLTLCRKLANGKEYSAVYLQEAED